MTAEPNAEPPPISPGSEAAYDRWASDYRDWWAPVIAPSAVRLLDRLDGLLPPDGPSTLVDIGTGTGTLGVAALRRWPLARAIGVDPARRLLEMAQCCARDGLRDRLNTRVGEARPCRSPIAPPTPR